LVIHERQHNRRRQHEDIWKYQKSCLNDCDARMKKIAPVGTNWKILRRNSRAGIHSHAVPAAVSERVRHVALELRELFDAQACGIATKPAAPVEAPADAQARAELQVVKVPDALGLAERSDSPPSPRPDKLIGGSPRDVLFPSAGPMGPRH